MQKCEQIPIFWYCHLLGKPLVYISTKDCEKISTIIPSNRGCSEEDKIVQKRVEPPLKGEVQLIFDDFVLFNMVSVEPEWVISLRLLHLAEPQCSGSLRTRYCPWIFFNFLEMATRHRLDIWLVHEPPTLWYDAYIFLGSDFYCKSLKSLDF